MYVDTVYEACSSLNHALVDHLLEWFVFASYSYVEQEFVPEAAVDEVTCSVFGSSYI